MNRSLTKNQINCIFKESSEIIRNSIVLSESIEKAIIMITKSIKNGKKIILFGNGGSAADAQHVAAEFVGRYMIERNSYPAISLTTDTSILTSISNDYSYDKIFSRQCDALVTKGDVVIGISTSGNSKNVKNGLITAQKKKAVTIAMLGNKGGSIKNHVDIPIIIPSSSTPRIQEVHRVIFHIICEFVEKNLISENGNKTKI